MVCVGCLSQPTDYVFLVDGSSSVSPSQFSTQRRIVKDMIVSMVAPDAGISSRPQCKLN